MNIYIKMKVELMMVMHMRQINGKLPQQYEAGKKDKSATLEMQAGFSCSSPN